MPAALLYSFDGFSISGDYDTGLNENKTVCEHVKIGKFGVIIRSMRILGAKWAGYAREYFEYCKIGEITIITYKTNGNKGIMTKNAKKL